MKNLLKMALIAFLFSSCCTSKIPVKPPKERSLDQVVQAVQDQYTKALSKLAAKNVKIAIKEADLTLKLSSVTTGNLGVTVLTINPSSTLTRTKTTSVTYVLSDAKSTLGGGADKAANDDKLCNLIVDAATKFTALNTTIGTLTKDKFSIDIVFGIANNNSVGITFKIFGQGADASIEHEASEEHELALTFVPEVN